MPITSPRSAAVAALFAALCACQGKSPPPEVVLSLSPTSATVFSETALQLSATVTGPSETGVTWSVQEASGGAVSATGRYTAPGAAGTFHVVAAAVADPAKRATATLTVEKVSVTASGSAVSLAAGSTVQLGAAASGTANTAVTWSVQEAAGGTISAAGLYSAPALGGTFHAVAASEADPRRTATVTLTVLPGTCTDGLLNQDEGGVDCGGGCPARCGLGSPCGVAADCLLEQCVARVCTAPAGAPEPTGAVTVTIPPGGGSVRAVTADRVALDLAFPAGAVAAPLDVTVTPVPVQGGTWAGFQLAPGGAPFDAPVAVTVTLPNPVTRLSDGFLFFGAPSAAVLLSTSLAADGPRYGATLLGFPAGDALIGHKRLQSAAAPAPVLSAGALIAADLIRSADHAFAAYDIDPAGYFQTLLDAIQAIQAHLGLLQTLYPETPPPPELVAWLARTQPRVCAGLEQSSTGVDQTTSIALSSLAGFRQIVTPLFRWVELDNVLDAGCPSDHYSSAFDNAAARLVSKFNVTVSADHSLTELRNLFLDLGELAREAQAFTATSPILGRDIADVQKKLMTPWRNAAWLSCKNGGSVADLGYLKALLDSGLYQAPFSSSDVAQDAHLCGLALQLRVLSPLGNTLSFFTGLGAGDSPGTANNRVSVRLPLGGKLQLTGRVRRYECPSELASSPPGAGTLLGNERVMLLVRDAQGNLSDSLRKFWAVDAAAPLARSFDLGNDANLAVSDLLTLGLGIDPHPAEVVTGTLFLSRLAPSAPQGPPVEDLPDTLNCIGFYSATGVSQASIELTVDLEFDPPPSLLTVSANPAAVALPATTQTFTLGFTAPGSTIVKLQDTMTLGPRTFATGWLDYARMSGHSGTGTFAPADIGFCTDSPAASKSDQFQLQDDLEQTSNAKSLVSQLTYQPACSAPVCKVCFPEDPVTGGHLPCPPGQSCGICGEPSGCGWTLSCPCGGDINCGGNATPSCGGGACECILR